MPDPRPLSDPTVPEPSATEPSATEPSATEPQWTELSADRALPRLLEIHGARIYRLALKLCGHAEDAEDLVQDVFLQAFRKWHQFQGKAKPTTWLYTIAARTCARRRRKKSGDPDVVGSLDAGTGPAGTSPLEGPVLDLDDGPLGDQLRREAREAVEAALVELPFHFRIALVLKDVVELPVADIADILGIKPATVKTRVHRARLMVRERLLGSPLPRRDAPPPIFAKRVCMDLLSAKQDALDRGAPFPVPNEEVCVRCEAFFRDLDLGKDTCGLLAEGELPPRLHKTLLETFDGRS